MRNLAHPGAFCACADRRIDKPQLPPTSPARTVSPGHVHAALPMQGTPGPGHMSTQIQAPNVVNTLTAATAPRNFAHQGQSLKMHVGVGALNTGYFASSNMWGPSVASSFGHGSGAGGIG